MTKALKPLLQQPPKTASIVAVLMPGPPPYILIDLFQPGDDDRIAARYTTQPENTQEACAAFELFLNGTLWGVEHSVVGAEIPAIKVT